MAKSVFVDHNTKTRTEKTFSKHYTEDQFIEMLRKKLDGGKAVDRGGVTPAKFVRGLVEIGMYVKGGRRDGSGNFELHLSIAVEDIDMKNENIICRDENGKAIAIPFLDLYKVSRYPITAK